MPEINWRRGPPEYRDVIAVVRKVGDKHSLGLACWNSTSDCWCVHWEPTAAEERFRHSAKAPDQTYTGRHYPPWPDNYVWTYLPEATP